MEGVDAAGKETQVLRLMGALRDMGYNVADVALPRYEKPIGKMIRQALTNAIQMDDKTMHMLMELEKQDYQPTIEYLDGIFDFLIMDRYTLSNLAYCMAKGIDLEWVKKLQSGLRKPDITFVLDITAETSYKRKKNLVGLLEMDKHELDSLLLNRARVAYLLLADKLSDTNGDDELIYVVDANQSPEEVHEDILSIVKLACLTEASIDG